MPARDGTAARPIRILYIGGIGRSGSSLLERILDQSDAFAAFGEIDKLSWSREPFDKRQLCGCGEPFGECAFWNGVMTDAFGSMAAFDPGAFAAARRRVTGGKTTKLPLLLGRGNSEYRAAFADFADRLTALYGAIDRAIEGRVIVDSSKDPRYAMALSRLPNVQVSFLHLVRDPRAVAYSWQRQKKRPEIVWEDRDMDTFGAVAVARRWIRGNAFSLAARLHAHRAMGLTYERFATAPRASLAAIARLVDAPETSVTELVHDDEVQLEPGHTVMGNPDRMARSVRIKLDDAWRRELSRGDRRQVARIVWPLWPLLWWYGRRLTSTAAL